MMAWAVTSLTVIFTLLLGVSLRGWFQTVLAEALGDNTARMEGRDSFDPISHADVFGTLIFPMLGVPFGWGRPVPVRSAAFRPGVGAVPGTALIALGGTLAHLTLAAVAATTFALIARSEPNPWALLILRTMVVANVTTGLLSWLPIPPLDGWRVLRTQLQPTAAARADALAPYGPAVLVLVLIVPAWFGFGPHHLAGVAAEGMLQAMLRALP